MKRFPRRRFLHLAAAAAAFPVASRIAWAQGYPSRPVRWVVPYPAGGSADIVARLVGDFVSARLGQAFIVENKPGAGSSIGTELVVKSPPDGHTLLFVTTANVINAILFPGLPFDFNRDITPVAGLVRLPIVLEVHPSVPVKNVAELIDYAKANPGKLNYASAGVGSSLHLATELFKSMAGVDLNHVPYRGVPPAHVDLLEGRVQVMFDNLFTSLEHIRSGKLRALGMSTTDRHAALPGVPTVAETVPGYEASSIFGLGVPAGTPTAIVERLNREINTALADPGIKARLDALTAVPVPMTHGAFRAELAATTQKWDRLIKAHGIKAT